jgi:hypothetical protein
MAIKSNCTLCGMTIFNPEENYKKRGNYCRQCDNRADTYKKPKVSFLR